MLKFLITGGAGFMGSNFSRLLLDQGHYVVNLDSLTYAASIKTIKDLKNQNNYQFIRCDINNSKKVRILLKKYQPNFVVNFAAETHVDRSIDNPKPFIKTNILGFFNLVNETKNFWDSLKKEKKKRFRFIQISTDEVYGDILKGSATEDYPIISSSPYSASKSSAEQIILSYFRTYKLPAIISRSSNNFGPYQFPEKLVPLSIINAIEKRKINIYGNGKQIRSWLFVDDHSKAILDLIQKGKVGDIYNIASKDELTNLNVVKKICTILDQSEVRSNNNSYSKLINFVEDRPGHDKRYSQNSNKLRKKTGWNEKIKFDEGLKITVDWYLNNKKWWKDIRRNLYQGHRLGIDEKKKT